MLVMSSAGRNRPWTKNKPAGALTINLCPDQEALQGKPFHSSFTSQTTQLSKLIKLIALIKLIDIMVFMKFEIKKNDPEASWVKVSEEEARKKLAQFYKFQSFDYVIEYLTNVVRDKGIQISVYECLRVLPDD